MKIGDKVVCVDIQPCKICSADTGLILNNIYVIESIEISPKGFPHLLLLGFTPKCHTSWIGLKPRSSITRFRLLDELKQLASQTLSQQTTAGN